MDKRIHWALVIVCVAITTTCVMVFAPIEDWPVMTGLIVYGFFYVFICLVFLFRGWRAIQKWRRSKYGHCDHCGYNLSGSVKAGSSECPECGETINTDLLLIHGPDSPNRDKYDF